MTRKSISWFITASIVAALLSGFVPSIGLSRRLNRTRRSRSPTTLPVSRRHPRV